MKKLLTAAIAILSVVWFTSSQEMCGTLGNNNETNFTVARARRLYLDINNPAPCAGTITKWRVCYYGPPNQATFTSYWATYGVYRRTSSNKTYERVSDTFSAVQASGTFVLLYDVNRTVDGIIQPNEFMCYDDKVESPVIVQAGDIIGACVFNPDNVATLTRQQLNVVGQDESLSDDALMITTDSGCTRESLPLSILTSELEGRPRVLHIYATIAGEHGLSTTPLSTKSPENKGGDGTSSNDSTQKENEQVEEQQLQNMHAIIGPAVGGGAAILVVVLLLSILVATATCYYTRYRKRKKAEAREFDMNTNVAYRKRQGEEQVVDYYGTPTEIGGTASSRDVTSDYCDCIKENDIVVEVHTPQVEETFASVENVAYKITGSPGYASIDFEA